MKRRTSVRRLLVGAPVAAALLIAAPAIGAPGPASDATALQVITSDEGAGGWTAQSYDCTVDGDFSTPQQQMQTGPATPALGAGSHTMTLGGDFGQTELWRTSEYDGTFAPD